MKTDLILLHGALGSKDQFIELEKILLPHFNIFSFNFHGHGGGKIVDSFSIDLFSNQLVDFINDNNISVCNIFGYSMGGYVALKTAITLPGILNKIMTLGTKLEWSPEISEKEIKMLDPELIQIKIPKFASVLMNRHAPEDWKLVMKQTADMMRDLGDGKSIKLSEFGKIKNEVLITLGSEDNMVSQQESGEVADMLPNGKLKIIDAPHPIEKVDVNELKSVIIDFFLA